MGAAGGKTEEAEDEPSAATGAEEEEQQHLQLASSAGSEESLAACLLRLHLLRVLPRRCPWSGRTSFVVGSRAISLSLSHLLKGRAREREEEKRGAIKEKKKQWRGEHISSALSQRDSFFLLLREFADTTNSFSHRHKTKQPRKKMRKKCRKINRALTSDQPALLAYGEDPAKDGHGAEARANARRDEDCVRVLIAVDEVHPEDARDRLRLFFGFVFDIFRVLARARERERERERGREREKREARSRGVEEGGEAGKRTHPD